jgi:hypothetical protein
MTFETPVEPVLARRGPIALGTPGAYRFLTESSDGTPQFLYVCLVDPDAFDGTG